MLHSSENEETATTYKSMMDLTNIILNERSQTQKNIYYTIPFLLNILKVGKLISDVRGRIVKGVQDGWCRSSWLLDLDVMCVQLVKVHGVMHLGYAHISVLRCSLIQSLKIF